MTARTTKPRPPSPVQPKNLTILSHVEDLRPAAPDLGQPLENIRILGRRIDKVTFEQALDQIHNFLLTGEPHQIITANTLMLLASEKNPELAEIIDQAALVVPESSGVLWASRQLGTPVDQIIPGIDLLQGLCQLARDNQRSVFLLGARPEVAEQAAVTLSTRYPGLRIIGTQHGFFPPSDDVAVVAKIHETAPDFLFVGLNVPGQELWIHRHLKSLNVPVVMGVGGSFDVLSGRLQRAPVWMRDLGIEWFFRMFQEPWRYRRILQLPVFAWKILRA